MHACPHPSRCPPSVGKPQRHVQARDPPCPIEDRRRILAAEAEPLDTFGCTVARQDDAWCAATVEHHGHLTQREAHGPRVKRERVELAVVLRNAVETSRPLIDEMGHELSLVVPTVPVYLDGDLPRLAQVVANLLSNSAKYTERGGRILLRAEQQGGEIVLTVEDNGVGIPADMLSRVFDMFTQVDRSIEMSKGGMGIGLSLVQRLVELHGGSVLAHSDGAGRGTAIVVRLPVVLSTAGSLQEDRVVPPPGSVPRRRILVVDDNRDAADSLAELLTIMGNETQTAYDGLQALAVAAVFRPDVTLLDIGMPKLNGYETCRRMRLQAWGEHMVLYALTGWGQEADQQRSLTAGFDAHLVKPVDLDDLEALLSGLPAARG
mgnify:CR=1 FL=1